MRKVSFVFIALVIMVMILPCVLIPVSHQSVTAENRMPAQWPEIISEDKINLDFPQQYEDWLKDNVAFRSVWISAYGNALRAIGTSSENQVILGRAGWLFFRDTLNDYTGTDMLSDNDVARLALVLDYADASLREQGSRLILAIAPNKASIYPEYMNPAYPRGTCGSNAERIMARTQVRCVDLFELLRKHSGEGLYFQTDTHWNGLGARYAANAILEAVQYETGIALELPDVNALYESRYDWQGDLANMLEPYSDKRDEQKYFSDMRPFSYKGRVRSPEDITIRTESDASGLKLLVCRDSFSNLLLDYISGAAGDVTYLRTMPLPLEQAAGTDAVVLEIVERRLGELLDEAPEIFAAAAVLPVLPDMQNAVECAATVNAAVDDGKLRISGVLDGSADNISSLKCGIRNNGTEQWYCAFPVSGDADTHGTEFSLTLPEISGDAQLCVYAAGDMTLCSGWVEINTGEK